MSEIIPGTTDVAKPVGYRPKSEIVAMVEDAR